MKGKNPQRQFFVLVGTALLGLAAWKGYRARYEAAGILAVVGACLLVIEFFIPPLASRFFAGWMAFAHFFGRVNTVVILSIIYFLVMLPISFFIRLGNRKSPFSVRAYREKRSSWSDVEQGLPRSRYFSPY